MLTVSGDALYDYTLLYYIALSRPHLNAETALHPQGGRLISALVTLRPGGWL